MLSLYEYEQTKSLMVAAHRGSSGTITENTLAAFNDAAESGVSIVELDIQFTEDNIPVVYHDFCPPGFDKRISEIKYDEIKNLKIGKSSASNYDSVHIPLLEDVVKLLKGRCYLMIEIKVNTGNKFNQNVEKLINMILNNNYQMNTIFGSFSHDALKKIKLINSSIYTAAIKIPGDNRLPSQIQNDTGCEAFICSVNELSDEMDDDVTRYNIFTGVYTVNDEATLNKVLKHNIRAIATNYPDIILKLLDKK
ncbi:MAG: glycerophosphodiester phosphodiesterase [Candidatus Kapabacteria bacterium]|nr:glycerophosphodiester phosphodiesterase [Ignavibacteriota bacterium]MCW5884741.1 glycerophosphodiester phosphodiesterase [Candidatus Kapabacteria bacterium]